MLGSAPVTTDATGNASFSFTFPTPAHGADFVSATATDPSGNTSEFSHDFGNDTPPTAVIGFTTLTVNEGVAVPFDGTGSLDPQGSPLTYTWSFGDGGTATGAAPIHTYRSAGDVHRHVDRQRRLRRDQHGDGHGHGQRRAAGVRPGSFTPPVTFAAPTPGDGFGAVGRLGGRRRGDRGPVRQRALVIASPGAVYLYDGVPTDDGVTTNLCLRRIDPRLRRPQSPARR